MKKASESKSGKKTTKNDDRLRCFSKDDIPLCIVEHVANEDLLFVKMLPNRICKYAIPYGSGHICKDSKRCESYKKHNIWKSQAE